MAFENNPTPQSATYDQAPDPLAAKVEWTPARGGGANFRTSRIVMKDPERLEFRSSLGAKLFCLLFLCSGLAVMILIPISMYREGGLGWNKNTLFPILFGLVFSSVGGGLLYFMARPTVFDRRTGHFWKGWKNPERMLDPEKLNSYTRLNRIHALQILAEYISGKSSYYSYELNLVLEDGSRINVTDHGDLKKLREDAETLSKFLGKPIWDRT